MQNILTKEELQNIEGGGLSWGAVGVIISIGVFIIGVVDGFMRPLACRS